MNDPFEKTIAFVDGDGVLWNCDERFDLALKLANKNLPTDQIENMDQLNIAPNAYKNVFWRVAFWPDLVALDMPIDGAQEMLEAIASHCYRTWILTSNPEHTFDARIAWLEHYNFVPWINQHRALLTQPADQQYTNTTKWKAEVVHQKIIETGAQRVIYIDDELANSQQVATMLSIAHPAIFDGHTEFYGSLAAYRDHIARSA